MQLEKFLEKSLKANRVTKLGGVYSKDDRIFIAINKSFYEIIVTRNDPEFIEFDNDKVEIHSSMNFYGNLDRVMLSVSGRFIEQSSTFYSTKQYLLQTTRGVAKFVLKWRHYGMSEASLALVKTKAPKGIESMASEIGFEPMNLLAS